MKDQVFIYCYTNLMNNKKYVGQTNNIERRKKQHIQDSIHNHNEARYNQIFHQAIRKYGIDNFKFEILEECIDRNSANKQENYWINKLNSMAPNGYNNSEGKLVGVRKYESKISSDDLKLLIQDLQNGVKIRDISKKYGISYSYVSDINNGSRLKQPNLNYPLQKNRLEDEFYLEVVSLLKNTDLSIGQIATQLNKSRDTISRINNGSTQKIRSLYKGSYPIRDNSKYKNKL